MIFPFYYYLVIVPFFLCFYIDDWRGLYLFGGPTFIINQYRDRERSVKKNSPQDPSLFSYIYDQGPYSHFLTYGLEEIVKTRNPHPMKGIFDSGTGSKHPYFMGGILDSVEGANDLCMGAHRVARSV